MTLVKGLHIACATLSITLFFIRGLWMMADADWRRYRTLQVAPHLVDTLLLASGIVLVWRTGQYPLEQPWLTAKIGALLAYIGLGLVALRFGRSKGIRVAAWLAALLVFGYMVAVALTRNPIPV